MAATDGGASSSATPAWPGTVSRRLNGVWRLQTPPASGSSVVPETLQICFRNVGEGSGARTTELAVLASGQRLESVDLERGDALVARTPDLRALLVVGPTTLSPRQRQNERLCSFGETRACEPRERVMFAFQFSNLDDAERCFDVLRPWLSATAPGASETRESLRAMLGISPEPAARTTPRDAHPEVLERPRVPSEAATRAELMTTAEVMAMMETVTVSANAGGDASGDARATADVDADAAAGADTERRADDAEPEPETRAKTTATETRETQTSIRDPDDPDDPGDIDARSEVEPWRWSSGVPPDVPDDTARAHVREMLRGCLAPGNQAVSGAAAAFARAPLGAGMPFDRYARLVGEAMDEMIRTGDIVVEGARGESDDDGNDSLDDDADDERDD